MICRIDCFECACKGCIMIYEPELVQNKYQLANLLLKKHKGHTLRIIGIENGVRQMACKGKKGKKK